MKLSHSFVIRCLIYFTTIFVSVSCTKYDEGGYSISAKKRITSTTWKLDTVISTSIPEDIGETNTDNFEIIYDFNKSGDFSQKSYNNDSLTSTITGSWEFLEKKHKIRAIVDIDYILQYISMFGGTNLSYEDLSMFLLLFQIPKEYSLVFDIVKLTKEELWLKTTIEIPVIAATGIPIEFHLQSK